MAFVNFQDYFTPEGLTHLSASITLALEEDGADLTAQGIFSEHDMIKVRIVAKEATIVVGLPLIPHIFEIYGAHGAWHHCVAEGDFVPRGTEITRISAAAHTLLKVERVILNYICHLSGIAQLTYKYVQQLEGTGVRLLDTRKTLPGLRWPEKYAVAQGGGQNHRKNLQEMLMLKDNHLDAAGSLTQAVVCLRQKYQPCPPIVVECRHEAHVREAIAAHVEHIMLDNMDIPALHTILPLIPPHIIAEVSGGIHLDTIRAVALASPRRPDYISVGRITHSAPAADLSMQLV